MTLTNASTMNITMALNPALQRWPAFTILPDFLLETDLADGRLRTGGIYALTAPTTVRSNALKAFLKMVQRDLVR